MMWKRLVFQSLVTRRGEPHPTEAELKEICEEQNWAFTGYYMNIGENASNIFLLGPDMISAQEVAWGKNKKYKLKIDKNPEY